MTPSIQPTPSNNTASITAVTDLFADFYSTAPETQPTTPDELIAAMNAQASYNASIRAYETEQERLDARKLSLFLCGKRRMRYINAESGKLSTGLYHCNLWRDKECPRCYANRVKYLRSRAHAATITARKETDNSHLLYSITCDYHTANSITRKLGQANYIRLPQQDGTELLILDGVIDGSSAITYDEISALNWENIVNTPSGRNISGNLGKPPPDEEDEDTIIVNTRSIVVNATDAQEIQAWNKAVEETSHLQPQDSDDIASAVEIAMEMRLKKYIKHLRKLGGTVLPKSSRIIKQSCRISYLSWSRNIENYAPLTPEQLSEIPF